MNHVLTPTTDEMKDLVEREFEPLTNAEQLARLGVFDIEGVMQVAAGHEVYAPGPPPTFTFMLDSAGPKVEIDAGDYGSLMMNRDMARQLRDAIDQVLAIPEEPVDDAKRAQIEAQGYTEITT